MSNYIQKFSIYVISVICFTLIFTSLNLKNVFAEDGTNIQTSDISKYSNYVEQDFYPSVEEAIHWEELSDSQYIEVSEEVVTNDEESYTEVEIEGSEFYLEMVPNDGTGLIMSPPPTPNFAELHALPFIMPAFYAIVARQGGKLIVKQYLKNSHKWIAIRNQHLAGKSHLVTGIKFDNKGFPVFKSQHTMTLPNTLLKSTNYTQFKAANTSLKEAMLKSSTVRNKFSAKQQSDILAGNTPRGYVWHHHQNAGVLQLVNSTTHSLTGHTGGKAIWGTLYSTY